MRQQVMSTTVGPPFMVWGQLLGKDDIRQLGTRWNRRRSAGSPPQTQTFQDLASTMLPTWGRPLNLGLCDVQATAQAQQV